MGRGDRRAPPRSLRSARFLLPLLLLACAQDRPTGPLDERRPTISTEEFERRIEAIEALVGSGREQEALESIATSIEDWPPERLRRRLQRIGYEIRRNRFYREHPLHFSLDVERPRFVFGDTIDVRLKITNLGAERVSFPQHYRSWLDALLFRPPEESVLQLKLATTDADGLGSRWGSERMIEIALDDDLVLAPGGSWVVPVPVALDDGGQALFRVLQIGAVYRPIAVLGAEGQRRYDPFEFPETRVRVFRKAQLRWSIGGLDLVDTCLQGESIARPEALFVAAVGLNADQLAPGIDRLVRAAPSLEPIRRRCAVAALQILTGRRFGDDPVQLLGWWEAEGRNQSQHELIQAAGLQDVDSAGKLWVGSSDAPR